MGAAHDIFRLYRVQETSCSVYLLVKAKRPEFPNWNQSAEDDAIEEVERRFAAIVTREIETGKGPKAEAIGSWEGGYPEGDCFFQPASGIDVEIWFSLDTVHGGYFVFGTYPDEASFWTAMEELSRDREICDISEYARPAKQVQVRFVQ